MSLIHPFNCTIEDDPAAAAAGEVLPSHWNGDHVIVDGLEFPDESPTAPAANVLKLFNNKKAGRVMAAYKSSFDGNGVLLQPFAFNGQVTAWLPSFGSSTLSNFGTITSIGTGAATAATPNTTSKPTSINRQEYLVTATATNAIAGWRSTVPNYYRGAAYNGFFVFMRGNPATGCSNTSMRFSMGMRNSTSAPADVNPSTLLNSIVFGWDDTDANCQIMYNDGTGTATKIDLGELWPVPVADRSVMYDVYIYAPRNSDSVFVMVEELVSGNIATAELTTDIPSQTTGLAAYIVASVGGVSSVVGIGFGGCYIETPK